MFFENEEHRVTKMISLENLIIAIENLETKGIISFEEFKQLPYKDIQSRFFAMPQPKTIHKAIIKITDKRNGKTGPSKYVTVKEYSVNGIPTKVEERVEYF